MQRVLDKADVLEQLAIVANKLGALGARGVSGQERLALLRRQAQLGDLRDAMSQRERRAG